MAGPSARARLAIVLAFAVVAALAAVTAVVELDDGDGVTTAPPTTTTAGASTSRPIIATTTSTSIPGTTGTTAPPVTTTTTVAPAPTTTTVAPPGEEAVAIRRGDPDRPVVYLTFDAGSDTGSAAEILDTLATNGIPATFGMTGRWAEANPGLVRRMVAEGHQLVNHSYDHPSFTGRSTGAPPLTRSERLDQLARADAAIAAATGTTSVPWFRPPYGDEDASVRADVAGAGYRYELLWTVDSLGWQGATPDRVVERCLDGAGPGAIYLFHVGAASTDHQALQRIIDGLTARGFGFATATDLVAG